MPHRSPVVILYCFVHIFLYSFSFLKFNLIILVCIFITHIGSDHLYTPELCILPPSSSLPAPSPSSPHHFLQACWYHFSWLMPWHRLFPSSRVLGSCTRHIFTPLIFLQSSHPSLYLFGPFPYWMTSVPLSPSVLRLSLSVFLLYFGSLQWEIS